MRRSISRALSASSLSFRVCLAAPRMPIICKQGHGFAASDYLLAEGSRALRRKAWRITRIFTWSAATTTGARQ